MSQQAVMVKVVARNVAAAKTMNLHPYALKVPSCKRSGNSAIDEENDSKVQLLKELIDACLKDLNHVGPLFGKLRERQSTAIVSEETPFRGVTQLRNLDEDFVISFLTHAADLSVDNLIAAKKHDDSIMITLLSYATQLPPTLRWCEALWKKEVVWRMFLDRAAQCGNRLSAFKKSGHVLRSGAVTWKDSCYTCKFEKDGKQRLTAVVHNATKAETIVPESVNYFQGLVSMVDNHLDAAAALVQPPNAPMKLSALFDAGTGPWSYMVFEKVGPPWTAYLKRIEDKYNADVQQAQSSNTSASEEAAIKLKQLAQEKTNARCAEARKKVVEKLQKRKQDKVIQFS